MTLVVPISLAPILVTLKSLAPIMPVILVILIEGSLISYTDLPSSLLHTFLMITDTLYISPTILESRDQSNSAHQRILQLTRTSTSTPWILRPIIS